MEPFTLYSLLPYRELLQYAVNNIISIDTLLSCVVHNQIKIPSPLPPESHAAYPWPLMRCLALVTRHRKQGEKAQETA